MHPFVIFLNFLLNMGCPCSLADPFPPPQAEHLRTAKVGLIPCNFIEALDEQEEVAASQAAEAQIAASNAAAEAANSKKKGGFMKGLFGNKK